MNKPPRFECGLSLIELIISIVIISIAITTIVATFSRVSLSSVDPMLQEQAIAVAEAYMEEITLKPFLDPDTLTACPVPEGARSLYDNVCDYDGLNDVGVRDQTGGAPIPGLEQFTVRATVQNSALNGVPAANSLRIDIRVSHTSERGGTAFLTGYRTQ